jgi:GntR family transcriptional regulator / MocR family aminotransferase
MKRVGAWPSRARSHLRSHFMITNAAPVTPTTPGRARARGRLLPARSWDAAVPLRGTSRIEQHALADFLTRGELDRHLRRMRTRYRGRRDALVEALTVTLPEAAVGGVAAGLHVTLQLPDSDSEQAIREEANHRNIELETMNDYRPGARSRPPTLLLGYGQMPEPMARDRQQSDRD